MKYLDLTLTTPAENLACDEALLDFCEETGGPEILRIWEPSAYFVVVGYANKVDVEVNSGFCREKNIPILRRCSGGGTVVQGPGSLNYSLILNFTENHCLQTITGANQFIMGRHRDLLEMLLNSNVSIEGHTDLVIGGRKFSGNAQRRKKNFLLFHGTFLLNFKMELIEQLLRLPSKQPCYRERRSHLDFLMNLHMPSAELKRMLKSGWNATDDLNFVPNLSHFVDDKYSRAEWNFKF